MAPEDIVGRALNIMMDKLRKLSEGMVKHKFDD